MFQLIRTVSRLELAVRQGPLLVVSFVVSTLFYEFGNFGLEAVAFLATWFALDAVAQAVLTVVGARRRVMAGAPPVA